MRFQDLRVGDHFIAMPSHDDVEVGLNPNLSKGQAFVVFRKISDIKLSGPIDRHIHDSGTAIRLQTTQQSECPQGMPVLKVIL